MKDFSYSLFLKDNRYLVDIIHIKASDYGLGAYVTKTGDLQPYLSGQEFRAPPYDNIGEDSPLLEKIDALLGWL